MVLSGPSGVGKGTVVSHAMGMRGEAAKRLRRSVSVTTRPRRPEESEGEDYVFATPSEFKRMVAAGELLEWATYLDHSYGTPASWVDEQLAAGRDVVLEIEVQGAMQVREQRSEAVLVYMIPPSWRSLRERLRRRRSESDEVQRQRLEVAREEIKFLPYYNYVVINDQVSRAAQTFLSILRAERARTDRVDVSGLLEENRA